MTINSGLAVQAKSGVGKKQLLKVVEIAMREWPVSGKASGNRSPDQASFCSPR
jgi:hypothetical protein